MFQAERAAALLEEEFPSEAESAADRLAAREAATPVPERVSPPPPLRIPEKCAVSFEDLTLIPN